MKSLWRGLKLRQMVLAAVIGLAIVSLAGCQARAPKTAPVTTAPEQTAAPAHQPAADPAPQPAPTPAPQASKVPKQSDPTKPVTADQKDQALADARKVTALATQVETFYQKAKEISTTYYGIDNPKGYSLADPLFKETMLVMEQMVGSVVFNLSPEVKEYQDAIVVEAAAKVHAIGSWKDALGTSDGPTFTENAGKFAQEASAAASTTAKVRAALAARLGVSVDALTAR